MCVCKPVIFKHQNFHNFEENYWAVSKIYFRISFNSLKVHMYFQLFLKIFFGANTEGGHMGQKTPLSKSYREPKEWCSGIKMP